MYFGNSWHKFNFVITPEEFEAIFNREDFEFVTNNTRVNIDYSRPKSRKSLVLISFIMKKCLPVEKNMNTRLYGKL